MAAAWLELKFKHDVHCVNRRNLMIAMPPMTKTAAAAIVPPTIFFAWLQWGILIRVNVHIVIEFINDNSRG